MVSGEVHGAKTASRTPLPRPPLLDALPPRPRAFPLYPRPPPAPGCGSLRFLTTLHGFSSSAAQAGCEGGHGDCRAAMRHPITVPNTTPYCITNLQTRQFVREDSVTQRVAGLPHAGDVHHPACQQVREAPPLPHRPFHTAPSTLPLPHCPFHTLPDLPAHSPPPLSRVQVRNQGTCVVRLALVSPQKCSAWLQRLCV